MRATTETAKLTERTYYSEEPGMSTFTAPIGVGNIDSREFVYVDALVNAGATYSIFAAMSFVTELQQTGTY